MTKSQVEALAARGGYYAAALVAHQAADDLAKLVEELRAEKQYALSDKLREVAKQLKDAASYPVPNPPATPGRYKRQFGDR